MVRRQQPEIHDGGPYGPVRHDPYPALPARQAGRRFDGDLCRGLQLRRFVEDREGSLFVEIDPRGQHGHPQYRHVAGRHRPREEGPAGPGLFCAGLLPFRTLPPLRLAALHRQGDGFRGRVGPAAPVGLRHAAARCRRFPDRSRYFRRGGADAPRPGIGFGTPLGVGPGQTQRRDGAGHEGPCAALCRQSAEQPRERHRPLAGGRRGQLDGVEECARLRLPLAREGQVHRQLLRYEIHQRAVVGLYERQHDQLQQRPGAGFRALLLLEQRLQLGTVSDAEFRRQVRDRRAAGRSTPPRSVPQRPPPGSTTSRIPTRTAIRVSMSWSSTTRSRYRVTATSRSM